MVVTHICRTTIYKYLRASKFGRWTINGRRSQKVRHMEQKFDRWSQKFDRQWYVRKYRSVEDTHVWPLEFSSTKHHLDIECSVHIVPLILPLPIKKKSRSRKHLSQRGMRISPEMVLYTSSFENAAGHSADTTSIFWELCRLCPHVHCPRLVQRPRIKEKKGSCNHVSQREHEHTVASGMLLFKQV